MSEDEDFIYGSTEIENNTLSDYYSLTNITRTLSNAKEDVFSQSNMGSFLNQDVEAKTFYHLIMT